MVVQVIEKCSIVESSSLETEPSSVCGGFATLSRFRSMRRAQMRISSEALRTRPLALPLGSAGSSASSGSHGASGISALAARRHTGHTNSPLCGFTSPSPSKPSDCITRRNRPVM
eukprot:scaffold57779_cov30-Tisochrysis_lutea.AAC.4